MNTTEYQKALAWTRIHQGLYVAMSRHAQWSVYRVSPGAWSLIVNPSPIPADPGAGDVAGTYGTMREARESAWNRACWGVNE